MRTGSPAQFVIFDRLDAIATELRQQLAKLAGMPARNLMDAQTQRAIREQAEKRYQASQRRTAAA